MTPSLFDGSSAQDELSLSRAGEIYRQRIRKHHADFITESDFRWLTKHHIEAIRIPIGYWLSSDDPELIGGKEKLRWAFSMAKKYNIKILLSIHGAPGSQNGKIHSGEKGRTDWFRKKAFQSQTLDFLRKVMDTYGSEPSLWGIELLNEPLQTPFTIPKLIRYYRAGSQIIREKSNSIQIVVSGDGPSLFWAGIAKWLGLVVDLHFYHSFGSKNRFQPPQKHIAKARKANKKILFLRKMTPLIIGEWSNTLGSNVPEEQKNKKSKQYTDIQIENYSHASAWFYWSYKTEKEGSWNFRSQVEKGIIEF